MAYRFRKKDRSVAHALRRIAREQVDKAISAIDEEAQADAVHDVRTRCKKLRGLIRIIRPSFEAYGTENADIRDIARLLGGLRENAVLKETLDQLIQSGGMAATTRLSVGDAPEASDDPDLSAGRLLEARGRLESARERIGGWTLAADEWEAVGPGVMRTFMRARAMLAETDRTDAVEPRHELRKQVKYHWHHLQLLRSMAPEELDARAELAAEIADGLGQFHDLAVLELTLRGDPRRFGSARQVKAVLTLAGKRRFEIEQQSLRLARRLLAESAEQLTRRLGDEWAAWQA